MAILTYKKYPGCGFATFLSIVSMLTCYGGVLCLIAGVIPAGIVFLALGVGIHFLAEAVAKRKRNKQCKNG